MQAIAKELSLMTTGDPKKASKENLLFLKSLVAKQAVKELRLALRETASMFAYLGVRKSNLELCIQKADYAQEAMSGHEWEACRAVAKTIKSECERILGLAKPMIGDRRMLESLHDRLKEAIETLHPKEKDSSFNDPP